MSLEERPPAIDAELVKNFVIAGHRDLETVKTMLKAEPGLLHASWDWGGGDFESALEGAAHVGQREIALYLIEKGARVTICTAAMLGELETVKQMITAFPALKNATGGHGIPLIVHAKAGGEQAADVVAYLESL